MKINVLSYRRPKKFNSLGLYEPTEKKFSVYMDRNRTKFSVSFGPPITFTSQRFLCGVIKESANISCLLNIIFQPKLMEMVRNQAAKTVSFQLWKSYYHHWILLLKPYRMISESLKSDNVNIFKWLIYLLNDLRESKMSSAVFRHFCVLISVWCEVDR